MAPATAIGPTRDDKNSFRQCARTMRTFQAVNQHQYPHARLELDDTALCTTMPGEQAAPHASMKLGDAVCEYPK
eukprot:scaffold38970_cov24-Prasinocladus_malaysianus.AAC.1